MVRCDRTGWVEVRWSRWSGFCVSEEEVVVVVMEERPVWIRDPFSTEGNQNSTQEVKSERFNTNNITRLADFKSVQLCGALNLIWIV